MRMPEARRGSLLRAGLVAGTLAAVIEMVPVLAIQGAALGVSPNRIFQSIASGVLGAAAYRGEISAMLLGAGLHWLISFGAALTFAWTATRWSDLTRHAVVAGLGYGVLVYAVMTAIVVPFSAVAFKANTVPALMLLSLAIHMVFFGLPIAIGVRWWFDRVRSPREG